jgi:hypothetical protein
MRIKIQTCWCGGDKLVFRALVCGGLRVGTETGKWDRKAASEMLDLLEVEMPGIVRRNVRFIHV